MKKTGWDIKTKAKIRREILNLSMAKRGSIWLKAYGSSMYPLIRNSDWVEIRPVSFHRLRIGDVIATKDTYQADTVTTHRLIKKIANPNLLLTKGDNKSKTYDAPVKAEYLIGKAVSIKRGRDIIKIDSLLWGAIGYIIAGLSLNTSRLTKLFLKAVSLFSIPRQATQKISHAIAERLRR